MRDEESPAAGIVREAIGPDADRDPSHGRPVVEIEPGDRVLASV